MEGQIKKIYAKGATKRSMKKGKSLVALGPRFAKQLLSIIRSDVGGLWLVIILL